jgi:hypothetical protein
MKIAMLMRARSVVYGAVTAALVGSLLLGAPPPKAHACGGFWCSQSAPVNQAAERIVFVDHAGDEVSAIIQIQYSGPSERFAWVIPIPGDPEIAISSNIAFTRLDSRTAPKYRLKVRTEGTCREPPLAEAGSYADAGAVAYDAGLAAPAIMVVDRGSVGPYDYATISIDPGLSQPAQAALDWFQQNGYDLTGVDAEVLGPYLAEGLNLLAFKLTKAAAETSGVIRPVILTYRGERPMIPIRPTAVAAERDMRVLVWIASEARAVPENYKSLVLNDALIDWFNPRGNYDEVVTQAADEAGGQGFVTEFAGSSHEGAQAVFSDDEAADLEELEGRKYEDGLDAIWAANALYRDWDGWRDAIAASVKLPPGTTLDDFARNPNAYRGRAEISAPRFFEELRAKVVTPVMETGRLLGSRPYLTRLYSTMSADEMTTDPAFTYNAGLPEVSNVHEAEQTIECDRNTYASDARWRIELPDGDVVRGAGYEWPIRPDMLPANRRIEQLSAQGQGRVLEDNVAKISAALSTMPAPTAIVHGDDGGDGKEYDEDDCAVSTPGTQRRGGVAFAAGLVGLALIACTRRWLRARGTRARAARVDSRPSGSRSGRAP